MTKPVWTHTIIDPTKPGHYRYRAYMHLREQVAVFYPNTQDNSEWNYGHSMKGVLMGMLPHDLEGQEYDAFRGFFLVWPGEKHPRPLEDHWDDYGATPPDAPAPPPKKKKAGKKKAGAKAPENLNYTSPTEQLEGNPYVKED